MSKQLKVNKALAEMILRVQGKDYTEWLDQMHQDVIAKNTNVIQQVTASVPSNFAATNTDTSNEYNSEEGRVE